MTAPISVSTCDTPGSHGVMEGQLQELAHQVANGIQWLVVSHGCWLSTKGEWLPVATSCQWFMVNYI